jgi:hypothetical protein
VPDPINLPLPIRGAHNQTTFEDQPTQTVPFTRIRNVLPNAPTSDRRQLSSRPGLVALSDELGFPIQEMIEVARRPIVDGFVPAPANPAAGYNPVRPITGGTSIPTTAISGNLFRTDQVPAMRWAAYVVDAPNGGSSIAVNAVAASPDNNQIAASINFNDTGGRPAASVSFLNDQFEAWRRLLTHPTESRSVNTLAVSTLYVLAAAGPRVVVMRRDTGAIVQEFNCGGYAFGVQRVRIAKNANGVETAYILFDGANNVGTTAGGIPISAGKWARCFRSGVMRCSLESTNINNATPLVIQPYPSVLPTTDPYYDGNHGYIRFSEQSPQFPRGCFVADFDLMPDGGFVVATSQTGWGPNATFGGTGYASPSLADVFADCLWRFDAAGVLMWTIDIQTQVAVGDAGLLNDLNDLNMQAVKVTPDGEIIVGYRTNSTGNNLACVRPDGAIRWQAKLQGASGRVSEGAIDMDTTGTSVWVGGPRNNQWTGASGANAMLWRVGTTNGSILATYDTGNAVTGLCVAAVRTTMQAVYDPPGVVYGTEYIS